MNVQDAVLSLIAERPDYGYRIVKRLEDEWSSAAVYKALGRLLEKGLIERDGNREVGKRIRKYYRTTQRGVRRNAAQQAAMLHNLPGRDEIIRRLGGELSPNLGAVIDEYERQVLAERSGCFSASEGLIAELVVQERTLVNEARQRWIHIAREAISDNAEVAA
jgi:DNA-binding PadR family transcriptional regulator